MKDIPKDAVQVLDHGFVRVVGTLGTDEDFIEAARMSTDKGFISWAPYERCKRCEVVYHLGDREQPIIYDAGGKYINCKHEFEKAPNGDLGLLDNLWRKKHATPFEMCEMVIEVQAPIFVFREWHRHRTQSYNEFSARYSEMPNLHYVPERTRFEPKASANKQESSTVDYHIDLNLELPGHVAKEQEEIYGFYRNMLAMGVPKEVARINTPVSRYSKMRAKADIRNWFAFLNLRMRPDAQWEIRQYANAVAKFVKSQWPSAWKLFEEYDLYGVHFSRTEMRAIREWMKGSTLEEASRVLKGQKQAEFLEKMQKGGETILA